MSNQVKTEQQNEGHINPSVLNAGLGACPFCGNEEFYRKGTYSGYYEYRYRFDGHTEGCDNSELHDYADYKENKTAYCASCNKKIPKKLMTPNVKVSGG